MKPLRLRWHRWGRVRWYLGHRSGRWPGSYGWSVKRGRSAEVAALRVCAGPLYMLIARGPRAH